MKFLRNKLSDKRHEKEERPAKYPQLSVLVTVSPPASPSVVAAILMIQKMSVTRELC